ncbi:MAG: DUF5675 family protein [Bacteroidia bacterium]
MNTGNEIHIYRGCGNDKQTNGHLLVYTQKQIVVFACLTLELPDNENQRKISCIPGNQRYKGKKHTSPSLGNCIAILDVPERDNILIHAANFYRQLLGCVAVGYTGSDMDNDGNVDITSSKDTLKALLSVLPDEFEIIIYNAE